MIRPRRIHTFDVFDTALTRVYIEPEDALRNWAETLSSVEEYGTMIPKQYSSEELFKARIEAERAAWKSIGYSRAVHISAIYQHLRNQLHWTSEQTAAAELLEMRIESEGLRPVPELRAKINSLRDQGFTVAFISDMHLPQSFIRERLSEHEIAERRDPIFVSSEVGLTKRSGGRLFSHAAKSLGVSPARLSHTGDDHRADVRMAQRRRVRSHPAVSARAGFYEKAITAELPTSSWREKTAAGALRLARLKAATSEPDDAELTQLLVSTVGPLVTGYALWLLDEAVSNGIDRLFFLARDMQIVAHIATRLAHARSDRVRCTYIHASRRAWQAPGYLGDEFDLSWLTDQSPDSTIGGALERILTPGQMESSGISRDSLQARLSRQSLREILARPLVSSAAQSASAQKRSTLVDYLASRGYRPDSRCAIVDAGWRGTLQKCLSRAYTLHGEEPSVTGLYLGLRHEVSPEPGSSLTAWIPRSVTESTGFSLVSLVESFLIADHGSTVGYRRNASGEVVAQLEASPSETLRLQHRLIASACDAYLDEFLDSPASQCPANALGQVLAAPLLRLCRSPRRRDAVLLRNWKYDIGRDAERLKDIAPPLRFSDFGRLGLARIRRSSEADIYLNAPWLRGSVASSMSTQRIIANALIPREQHH